MKLFRVSIVVVIAVSALMLTACAAGPVGPRGATGAQGPVGKTGPSGSAGADGTSGTTATNGVRGATGPAGASGAPGAPGATGTAGGAGSADAPQYAYVYNLLFETINSHENVVFSDNGDISSGIVHVPGTADVVVNVAGEYEVSFTVSAVEPNQFGISRNHSLVAGTLFGTATGGVPNTGSAILSLAAGDVVTIQNDEATSSYDLTPFAGGGLENADATLAIHKIG